MPLQKKTIADLPDDFCEDVSFRLTVKNLAVEKGPHPLVQILEADTANATIWRRHSDDKGATWSKWQRLITSDEYEKLENQVTELKQLVKGILSLKI